MQTLGILLIHHGVRKIPFATVYMKFKLLYYRGIVTVGLFICDSTIFEFPVYGEEYAQVCGRIKAYQFYRPDAFEAYDDGDVTTIDCAYMCVV